MSALYASIQGSRGEATRCGSKSSGIESHTRGWSAGVQVYGHVADDGEESFEIWATTGSGGAGSRKFIGTVVSGSNGPTILHGNPTNR